jgi:hypothetical protein
VLARLRRSWDAHLTPGNAAMKLAPANGLRFFAERRWRIRSTRSLLDEAERLGREVPMVKLT